MTKSELKAITDTHRENRVFFFNTAQHEPVREAKKKKSQRTIDQTATMEEIESSECLEVTAGIVPYHDLIYLNCVALAT